MADDPYIYPGTHILKNKLDILDADMLDLAERRLTTVRAKVSPTAISISAI